MLTSYFAKVKGLPDVVSIAAYQPSWLPVKLPEYLLLAPPIDLVIAYKHGKINEATYTKAYNMRLCGLDAKRVYSDLHNKILVCWEKYDQFCHRRLVAKWIRDQLGIFVPEYRYSGTHPLYNRGGN